MMVVSEVEVVGVATMGSGRSAGRPLLWAEEVVAAVGASEEGRWVQSEAVEAAAVHSQAVALGHRDLLPSA